MNVEAGAADRPVRPSMRRSMLIVAPSAELYGSDRSLLDALPELVEAFEVTIAFPQTGPTVEIARSLGAHTVTCPDYALRRRHLSLTGLVPWLARVKRSASRLGQDHRHRPFDLIYSNTLAAFLGHVLHLQWRIPHIVHIREHPVKPVWLPRALMLLCRASATRLVCNSHHTRAAVTAVAPQLRDRSTVIHNGLELPEPRPRTTERGSLAIACVGRIHPKKGQDVLVQAAAIGRDQGRDWHLHFYGDSLPEHAILEQRLRDLVQMLGLGDRSTFHGFVDDTTAAYARADVAVVPSVTPEEFSRVCVEAQALEVPVVATGPGGPSEILVDGETGFIVPPSDPDALATALLALDDDPARRVEMGRAGRRRMQEHFARDVYARKVADLCLEVAGSAELTSRRS